MTRLLHDDNVQVRRNAIGGFMSLEQQGVDLRPAVPEILKMVDDKDDSVRRSLAVLLGDMGRAAGVAFRQLDAKSDERAIESGRQFLMIERSKNFLATRNPTFAPWHAMRFGKSGPTPSTLRRP